MAQIKTKNQGLTLIELILYVSIFCMIFLVMMSSIFYIQKIIQTSNQTYYVKNEIYENLDILQQYLYKTHVSIDGNSINMFDAHNNLLLTQSLAEGHVQNKYIHKTINPLEYIVFQTYNLQLLDKGRILQIEFSWLDGRGRSQKLTEYLIVINQKL